MPLKEKRIKGKNPSIKARGVAPKQSCLDLTPYFAFDKVHKDFSLNIIPDKVQQAAFIEFICLISKRTWKEIRSDSNYKGFGMEPIKQCELSGSLPSFFPEDKTVWAFHYHSFFAFIGYTEDRIFHVIGVDSYGHLCYDHS